MKKVNEKRVFGSSVKNSKFSDCQAINEKRTIVEDNLKFVFKQFRGEPISIDGQYNSHYRNQEDYISKITALISVGLPQLSNEMSDLFSDPAKMKSLHMHLIRNEKVDTIRTILNAYNYSGNEIDSIIDGEQIYQFEIPIVNGSSRVVFEKIGTNIISLLFLDPNHHIFLNKGKVKSDNSMYFEFCPECPSDKECETMKMLGTCVAVDYFDYQKFEKTFNYKFKPKIK